MSVFCVEVLLPGNLGVGYLRTVSSRGAPTYTFHLRSAARFDSERLACAAAGKVPPALEPVLVRLLDALPPAEDHS